MFLALSKRALNIISPKIFDHLFDKKFKIQLFLKINVVKNKK